MSGGQIGLSEADAQQFLNYAETAYAEQETTNQEQQPIKKENKAYMERAVTITQQIDNLNNSTALSATEVRHVADNLQVPDCMSILSSMPQKQSTDLYDCPYFECSDFMNPKHMTTIEPTYTQHLNPDERVYKICIQMSDDLAVSAYKKSNFFISIRNHKEKMSIKNFIKYLS